MEQVCHILYSCNFSVTFTNKLSSQNNEKHLNAPGHTLQSPGSSPGHWQSFAVIAATHTLRWKSRQVHFAGVHKKGLMFFPKQNWKQHSGPRGPMAAFLITLPLCLQHIPPGSASENQSASRALERVTEIQKLKYLWFGSPVSLWGTSPRNLLEFPLSFSQGECLEQPFSM